MKKWLCFAALLGLFLAGCTPANPAVPDEPLTVLDQEPLIEQDKELVIAENGATRSMALAEAMPWATVRKTSSTC